MKISGCSTAGLPHDHAGFGLIVIVSMLSVAISIPNSLFSYFNAYLVSSVTYRIGTDVRDEMYAHLQTLSLSFFHRSRIGDIMSRMSNDVGLIQQSSAVIMQAIDGPVMIVGGSGQDVDVELEADHADSRFRAVDGDWH